MFGISVALEGYGFNNTGFFYNSGKGKTTRIAFDALERILFAVAGLLCVIPEAKTDIIGVSLLAALLAYQLILQKVRGAKATV